jgi:hypothetical protein
MTTAAHTPEPISVQSSQFTVETINGHKHMTLRIGGDTTGVCIVILPEESANSTSAAERRATANRIVATYNALAGVADPAAAVARWKRIEEAAREHVAEWDAATSEHLSIRGLRSALAPEVRP